MKKVFAIAAMAALVCAGCTTASRTVTGTSGTTQSTKVSTFLTTVQGFDDSVSPDGTSHTIIANYSGDVQMVNALNNLLNNLMSKAVLLAGNTNMLNLSTNLATK